MPQLVTDRRKIRLACEVRVKDRRHSGMVLNVSPSGLFVQTNAKPATGDCVAVELSVPGRREPLQMDAAVAWVRAVPSQLVSIAQGGFGARLVQPPEDYYQFLYDVEPAESRAARTAHLEAPRACGDASSTAARATPAARAGARFRVRVSHGPRSRTLLVEGRSEQEARRRALEQVGGDWKVLEATPL